MKKFFKTIAVLCMAVAASSCGTMLQNSINSGTNLTNVELSHANYRIVKNVEGFASASYVLGIGGLSQKATRDNAIADMMRKANLTDSQAIVNVHIKNHFSSVLFFYMRHSCTATAQVIEFLPETNTRVETNRPGHSFNNVEYQPMPAYQNNSGIDNTNITAAHPKKFKIGDMYDDGINEGIIFEISENGQHGKIVYPKILAKTQWCDSEYKNNLPKTIDSEDGEKNMQIIKAIPDWQNKFPAFAACANLGSQWYLPANNELMALSKIPKMRIKLSNAWSSTIHNTQNVETLNGYNTGTIKTAVVAVAKF